MGYNVNEGIQKSLIFVYGILKRGQSLDLEKRGHKFIGPGAIEGATLRPIGGGVGLLFDEDTGYIAYGEVFEIPDAIWPWLDFIEDNGRSYTRKQVEVSMLNGMAPKLCWVYEHTYPNMAYADPIPSGCFPLVEDEPIARWPIEDYEFDVGGEG